MSGGRDSAALAAHPWQERDVVILAEARLEDGRLACFLQPAPADAARMLAVIQDAFSHRPPIDPPPPALSETVETVRAALATGSGVLAEIEGEPAGALIVVPEGAHSWITRVSVRPAFQRQGIASAMVEVALDQLAELGVPTADLIARAEFPPVVRWWRRHGFQQVDAEGTRLHLARALPVCVEVPTAEDMQRLGRGLAAVVAPGDLILASGDLGAGKTTFTQGLGAGMGVSGAIISPTFVLARIHPNPGGGPGLVHVDAYRLGSFAEVEDLDLDVSLADSVTLVEWGEGVAEGLSDDRLEIDIRRSLDPADDTRWVFLTPIGDRWADARPQLEALRDSGWNRPPSASRPPTESAQVRR
ncbi:MAG: tRNA (adenosine(37)-N6)-threonylcarbamoyltransferase complex ATPase subunit type 1 TsaE [Propionicimonas sp.]|nr:tRNA (adenosine(37)-N6)-threonylcarbamoyltransferase complex ATPase subunit type 1 TsaE [Propionicimonas sp.]